jgi:biopolymer transport protein ExbD
VFVKYGTVVSVINALRTVGIEQIGLVSEKKKHTAGLRGPDHIQRRPVSPASRSRGAALSLDPPMIDVRSRTRLRLNSKPILLSRLESQLQELLDGRERKTVFIKAPSKMAYGDVIKVIDIAKGVGAQPIGLQIDRLEAKPR